MGTCLGVQPGGARPRKGLGRRQHGPGVTRKAEDVAGSRISWKAEISQPLLERQPMTHSAAALNETKLAESSFQVELEQETEREGKAAFTTYLPFEDTKKQILCFPGNVPRHG